MTVLLPLFQVGCFLFLPPLWLQWLGLPVLCWMNTSGESRRPCVVADLKGGTFSFCPLSMMLAACFLYMAFIMLRYATSSPILMHAFIINGRFTFWNAFSHAFSAPTYMIMRFLSFILFMWLVTFIDLHILYHPCTPGMNPTRSWCMIF